MSISLLLEMACDAGPDRTAVVADDVRLTTAELSALADGGAGVIAASGAQHVAYVGTGGALLPLLLFAAAARRIPLTTIGLLQFMTPIMQLLCGVLVLGEHMSAGRWVGFGLVWLALVALTLDSLQHATRTAAPDASQPPAEHAAQATSTARR